ncbi:MAG: universal stress protein [Myxococcales bacterium]|nr:universal stress protein [Myxococcales bacterium]
MRWIVGLDLTERSAGAITFARWFHQHLTDEHFLGAHIIEASARLQAYDIGEMSGRAALVARKMIADAGAAAAIPEVEVRAAEGAARALEELSHERSSVGIIVGRKAPRGERPLVALGRIARRLVRRAPTSLIVVPPDLSASDLGGPIVVATDLTESAARALHFARGIARETGLPLVVAHVVEVVDALQLYVPTLDFSSTRIEARARSEAAVDAWLRDHYVAPGPEITVALPDGPVFSGLSDVIEEHRPSLVVCGSRRLSATERLFLSSVGTELASRAPTAVAIIPFESDVAA